MCGLCGDKNHNSFTGKYKAKLSATKEKHDTEGSIKKMGISKALKKRTK